MEVSGYEIPGSYLLDLDNILADVEARNPDEEVRDSEQDSDNGQTGNENPEQYSNGATAQ